VTDQTTTPEPEPAAGRVGRHQPRNLYCDERYAAMFVDEPEAQVIADKLNRIAEMEENVRALGGDPDHMVDPRDHEAAIAAMREEMTADDRPWPPTFWAWVRAFLACRREGHAEIVGGYCIRCARGLAPVAAPAGGEER
jgi:hypothetical protein